MTTEQKQFIENLKIGYANLQAEESEKSEYRMQNYFNCVDDYSWGGISDTVSRERLRTAERRIEIYLEQFNGDGFLYKTNVNTCLFDLENNFITDNVVNTKYGNAFLFNNQFISVAKKMETYFKKGYTVKNRVRTYKMQFSGKFSKKGNPVYLSIEVVNEVMQEFNEFGSKSYLDWIFENNN